MMNAAFSDGTGWNRQLNQLHVGTSIVWSKFNIKALSNIEHFF
jgi:hypothetical protein